LRAGIFRCVSAEERKHAQGRRVVRFRRNNLPKLLNSEVVDLWQSEPQALATCVQGCFCRATIVDPFCSRGTYRKSQYVAGARDGLYLYSIFAQLLQRSPQYRYDAVKTIIANSGLAPADLEELSTADDLAGTPTKRNKKPHYERFYADGLV
jgi:hypothetical protein